jgi:hypothetical protein
MLFFPGSRELKQSALSHGKMTKNNRHRILLFFIISKNDLLQPFCLATFPSYKLIKSLIPNYDACSLVVMSQSCLNNNLHKTSYNALSLRNYFYFTQISYYLKYNYFDNIRSYSFTSEVRQYFEIIKRQPYINQT